MSRIQTVNYAEGLERRAASAPSPPPRPRGAQEVSGLDRDLARALVQELTLKADSIASDAT